MKVDNLREIPVTTGIPEPRKQWPTVLLVLVLFMALCGGTYGLLKAGEAHSDKPFGNLVLDGMDGGLKVALPTGLYQTVNKVMTVYLKPADQIRKAQAVLNGVPDNNGETVRAKSALNSFFDSWLAVAAVVCTGLGLAIRLILNLFVYH